MSLFRGISDSVPIWQGLPTRSPRRMGNVDVTTDSALTHSAVWAATRIRSDMISQMDIECFRLAGGVERLIKTPNVLITPSSHGDGQPMDIVEWMYSSQMDLDRLGNAFGLIAARDSLGYPSVIDPISASTVVVSVKHGRIDHYKVGKKIVSPLDMWHERANTIPGVHVGLSPVAYAAASIGSYLSAQQFALDWFSNGAVPGAVLKNTSRTLRPDESAAVKKKFQTSLQNGETFVTGMDWDYKMIQATAAESAFLESMQYSISDIARFFNVPADMLDGATSSKGGKIVYSNITQFNLQFLVQHLSAAVKRRETALSRILPNPQHLRLSATSLLRMDPAGVATMNAGMVAARLRVPSELRLADNLQPYTPEQIAEFKELFGAGSAPAPVVPPADDPAADSQEDPGNENS